MRIIKISASKNGSRPALQEWSGKELPYGYAWCEDKFASVFYSTSPAGFVNIVVKKDSVTDMSVNETAFNEYMRFVNQEDGESEVTDKNGA